jgi:hypothetical protein
MFVIIEDDIPGKGHMRVASAHWVLVGIYGLGSAGLLRVLYRTIGTSDDRDNAVGLLLILAGLFILMAIHFVAAIGARNQRPWARTLSRTMAVLLFLFLPIGTAWSIFVMRNTRSGRWDLSPVISEERFAGGVPQNRHWLRTA